MSTFEYTNMNRLDFKPVVSAGRLAVRLEISGELLFLDSSDLVIDTVTLSGTYTVEIRVYDDENANAMSIYEMGQASAWSRNTSARPYYSYKTLTVPTTNGERLVLPIYIEAPDNVPKAQVVIIRRQTP